MYFPIDATRASINGFLDLIEKVSTEGHMDALGIVDTFGGLAPTTVSYLVKKIKSRISKPLEAHFHDDFGLAAANTLIALSEGVEVAHTTVSSIGERAGNAGLEQVVLSLLTLYDIDLGIDCTKLYPLSKLVLSKIPGYKIATNRPIVGDRIFNVESGIIADWVMKCGEDYILEAFPFKWDLVGQDPPRIVLGKGSGGPSIIEKLDEIGIKDLNQETLDKILMGVKEKSLEKKDLLTQQEFKTIVRGIISKGG